ncbi:hypothetical protein MKZ12_08340 [Paenibacillus sp. FSL R5-0713]|uniref:hypothetical protein n=1 Tax=Paenibacillus sp. FSL R5-0713 TaxID=2921655 RepID=UPI0030D96E0D
MQIFDIRQKPEVLQEAVQYFWKHWGQSLGGQLQNHALSEVKAKRYNKLYLCTDLTDFYERNNWDYISRGYLLDDEETRIYEYQI